MDCIEFVQEFSQIHSPNSYFKRSERVTRHRQRGASTVELAIIFPFMLLLVAGTVEFGRAFLHYNTLHKAARDGARYLGDTVTVSELNGGFNFDNDPRVIDAKNLTAYGSVGAGTPLLPDLSPNNVVVSSPDDGHISVSVTYNYQMAIPGFLSGVMGLVGGGIQEPLTLHSTALMTVSPL
jgi:TadE-like protein